jgi:hypothetical protein
MHVAAWHEHVQIFARQRTTSLLVLPAITKVHRKFGTFFEDHVRNAAFFPLGCMLQCTHTNLVFEKLLRASLQPTHACRPRDGSSMHTDSYYRYHTAGRKEIKGTER